MPFTHRQLFYIVLALLTLFRLSIIGLFELAPDEAYYWTWSQRLDWSYYDQGPFLALIIKFFTTIVGHTSEWSVRLGSVILSVVSSWLIFDLTDRLFKSTRAAWYAFLGLNTTLLLSAGAILMMHDSIMIMFWMAALYFFYQAIIKNKTGNWYLGALMLGCGGLSKYTMALFVPGLLLFLILSPQHRMQWKKPHLYLAGLITLVLVSPIFIWNHIHDWASFGHIGDLGGISSKHALINFKKIGNFLGGQLGVLSPVLGFFCLASPFIAFKQWRIKNEFSTSFLFTFSFTAPILLFFLLLSFQTNVYANWPAPAYLTALMLLAGWVDQLLKHGDTKRVATRWLVLGLAISILFTTIAHLQLIHPIIPLKGRAAESMNRIRGWREVGVQTQAYLARLENSSTTPVFLAARRYQLGGILWFYTPDHRPVQLFGRHQPMKSQFRIWDQSEALQNQHALFVCQEDWELDHIRHFFETIEILPEFKVIRNGQEIRTIKFCFCYNLKIKLPASAKD